MSHVMVLTSVAKAEDAEWIAREVVERRLAACVNVLPATSVYRWKGDVEKGEEIILLMKTTRGRFEALRDAIVSMHTYEVPEIIALPIEAGHAPYLAWIDDAVGD